MLPVQSVLVTSVSWSNASSTQREPSNRLPINPPVGSEDIMTQHSPHRSRSQSAASSRLLVRGVSCCLSSLSLLSSGLVWAQEVTEEPLPTVPTSASETIAPPSVTVPTSAAQPAQPAATPNFESVPPLTLPQTERQSASSPPQVTPQPPSSVPERNAPTPTPSPTAVPPTRSLSQPKATPQPQPNSNLPNLPPLPSLNPAQPSPALPSNPPSSQTPPTTSPPEVIYRPPVASEAPPEPPAPPTTGKNRYIDPVPTYRADDPTVERFERSSGCQTRVRNGQLQAGQCPAIAEQKPRSQPQNRALPKLDNLQQVPAAPEFLEEDLPDLPEPRLAEEEATPPTATAPDQKEIPQYRYEALKLKHPDNGDTALLFPLPSPAMVTSTFGWRIHPIFGTRRFHRGTDFAAPEGTPVVAAYSGRVAIADYLSGYGLTVALRHDDGTQESRYTHLSVVHVKPGEWVEQGRVIGRVGSTGHSTGPHLHFEWRTLRNGRWVALDAGQELYAAMRNLSQAPVAYELPEGEPFLTAAQIPEEAQKLIPRRAAWLKIPDPEFLNQVVYPSQRLPLPQKSDHQQPTMLFPRSLPAAIASALHWQIPQLARGYQLLAAAKAQGEKASAQPTDEIKFAIARLPGHLGNANLDQLTPLELTPEQPLAWTNPTFTSSDNPLLRWQPAATPIPTAGDHQANLFRPSAQPLTSLSAWNNQPLEIADPAALQAELAFDGHLDRAVNPLRVAEVNWHSKQLPGRDASAQGQGDR